jgi:hypothetical protein
MWFSLWGLWVGFECYQIVAVKDAAPQKEGKGNPQLDATPLSFKMSLQRDSDGK